MKAHNGYKIHIHRVCCYGCSSEDICSLCKICIIYDNNRREGRAESIFFHPCSIGFPRVRLRREGLHYGRSDAAAAARTTRPVTKLIKDNERRNNQNNKSPIGECLPPQTTCLSQPTLAKGKGRHSRLCPSCGAFSEL